MFSQFLSCSQFGGGGVLIPTLSTRCATRGDEMGDKIWKMFRMSWEAQKKAFEIFSAYSLFDQVGGPKLLRCMAHLGLSVC